MTIPLAQRAHAFQAARMHVQAQVDAVDPDFRTPHGLVRITGRVVRIFRAPESVHIGAAIAFSVPAARRQNGGFPDGGQHCWYEDLLDLPCLEVCLNGEPPNCTLAADLHEIVERPTERPVISFAEPSSQTDSRRKWWKPWQRF